MFSEEKARQLAFTVEYVEEEAFFHPGEFDSELASAVSALCAYCDKHGVSPDLYLPQSLR